MQSYIDINECILGSYFPHYKSEHKEIWDLENRASTFHMFLLCSNEFSFG